MIIPRKILAVDDDPLNRDILMEYLTSVGYEVIEADDGDTALQILEEVESIDVLVLDRMMPRLNGMEVLKAVKKNPKFADVPVIMQSAASARDQILEGIQAGVYYYLTKPYEDQMLLALVAAALKEAAAKKRLREEVHQQKSVMDLMMESRFRFRTLEEAKNLAFLIGQCFPDPAMTVYGLHELLINAVEHGNLGISYSEKMQLIMEGALHEEINRRLALPENRTRYAHLTFQANETELKVVIKDDGKGFDWHNYLEMSPERATHPNGRGIATSRQMSFHTMEYLGCGNEVVCTVVRTGER